MTEVLLSLGANVGDRVAALANAIRLLRERAFASARVSDLYETEPVGFAEQPSFLNLALAGKTALAPEKLAAVCKTIERELGRKDRPRWHEREIDIDIALYGTLTLKSATLEIPHPQMLLRRFVLAPASDVAPAMIHPTTGKSVRELLRECPDASAVEKFDNKSLNTTITPFNQA